MKQLVCSAAVHIQRNDTKVRRYSVCMGVYIHTAPSGKQANVRIVVIPHRSIALMK